MVRISVRDYLAPALYYTHAKRHQHLQDSLPKKGLVSRLTKLFSGKRLLLPSKKVRFAPVADSSSHCTAFVIGSLAVTASAWHPPG